MRGSVIWSRLSRVRRCFRNSQETKMLGDLSLRQSYRSSRQELLKGFYIPCMREATSYSRAVGYFTSHVLSAAAEGLGTFIERGGRMRLVASPMLDQEDAEAISKGYAERGAVESTIAASLLRELEASMPNIQRERLGFLAWMVAEGQLEMKIALVSRGRRLAFTMRRPGCSPTVWGAESPSRDPQTNLSGEW
jgi:hypothetical protein